MASYKVSGTSILNAVLNLIRYDIPCLLLGKSSIGKSYSVLTMAKKFRLPHNVLFVGSEKAEHIEGLPKLITSGSGGGTGKKSLEYFTPWWFPQSDIITNKILDGQKQFKIRFSEVYNSSDFSGLYKFSTLNSIFKAFYDAELIITPTGNKYNVNETLNGVLTQSWGIIDSIEHGNILIYLSTLLGYGNFWLILDEIDKVEEMDIEKYAPLLHIVRERMLKDYSLREINSGKGIDVTTMISDSGSYFPIDTIIEQNKSGSLLDTRVIAVANATDSIEEALFRRFVQVIVEDILIWDTSQLSAEQLNLKNCVETTIQSVDEMSIGLDYQKIDEVNLQWQFNFLPKIVNKRDLQGNFFRIDYLEKFSKIKINPKAKEQYEDAVNETKKQTLIYKILEWSYDTTAETKVVTTNAKGEKVLNKTGVTLIDALFDCLKVFIEPTVVAEASDVSKARNDIKTLFKENKNDVDSVANEIISIVNTEKPENLDQLIEIKQTDGKTLSLQLVLEDWFSKSLAWIEGSILDENDNKNNDFKYIDLYQKITPQIYEIILKYCATKEKMAFDNIKNFYIKSDEMWKKISSNATLEELKMNSDYSMKLLHQKEDDFNNKTPQEQAKGSLETFFGLLNFDTNIKFPVKVINQSYYRSLSFKLNLRMIKSQLPVIINGIIKEFNSNGSKLSNLSSNTKELVEFYKKFMPNEIEQIRNSMQSEQNVLFADFIKIFSK